MQENKICVPDAESTSSSEEESERRTEERIFPAPEARVIAEWRIASANQLGLLGGGGGWS